MAERDFYNIGDFITYPLVSGDNLSFVSSGELPRRGLVDAGFMFGLTSEFVIAQHDVFLYSVEITISDIKLDFRSNAPGLSGYRWYFIFPIGTAPGCVDYVDASTIVGNVPDRQRGSGYLNVGDLTELVALGVGLYVLSVTVATGLPPRVEPALLQSLIGSFVQDINLADDFRLCPDACCDSSSSSSSSSSAGIDDALLVASGMTGAIKFKEGYNAQIQVDPVANAIVIGAGVGLGAGQTCHDLTIDENGISSDACGTCQGFIRSINGITTKTGGLSLAGGPGVTVATAAHKLVVKMDVTQLCLLSSSSSSSG